MLPDLTTDMHSEAWWMRALEGELSHDEERHWQAHLAQCPACQQEWAAMMRVETLLRTAAPAPLLTVDFTARTVAKIAQKQKLRSMLRFIVGFLLLALVAWIGFLCFDASLASLFRTVPILISSRQILFAALMRTLVGLALTVRTLLPLIGMISVVLFLLLMPNSVFATMLLMWLGKKRAQAVAVF